ncbi:putative low-affinity inorganic phosphate transporter [Actinokineospora spheciospongiae]|uniref:Phosphate transporter n=1 Tax=Actinokineospora spheciospongiae TaxID=909613 RepID=W7IS92_9PSEU|nr:inorganic phosphate transporter [Actinokineospora spheciospongiae]EWC63800.1 putative low-affinity inorganic phosphate transporter [Actinokineospora spheciospongiae]PWW56243.1 PiT family inorganic phosphate transporter [Actinokineospora spheciospongiae]
MDLTVLVPLVVVTALVFDFTNGFHDTANAMATSIATGALRPKVAVALSAVLNLVGAFLSVEVAKTISGGLVDDAAITPEVVFGGLIGAIVWNLLTWYVGLPSSSSHALFGGLVGATWVAAGSDAVHFAKLVEKVLVPAVAAPVVAGVAGGIATYLAFRITRRATASRTPRGFRIGQIASASLLSLAHGTNDAQKTMGIITLTLISAGSLPTGSGPPTWVIVSAGLAIAAGTYLGGWRIIRTLGRGITDIGAPQGFAAQTSATAVILTSSHLGIALSTTHVCSGGILGAGLGTPQAVVRWGTAGRMVLAWLITLPAAGVAGALAGAVAESGTVGTIAVAVLGAVFGGAVFLLSRRNAVSAHNVNDIPVEPVTESAAPVAGGHR